MALDAHPREGPTDKRYSIFVGRSELVSAIATGWADYTSSTHEVITCCYPTLLPAYLETLAAGVSVPADSMRNIVNAAGLGADAGENPEERARRACSALVRDARFGKAVVDAYGGHCAMCGLNSGLVEGAHIYPAAAPGAEDAVWNGLALCCNHHAGFDRHMFYVEPSSREIRVHVALQDQASKSEACAALVKMTRSQLSEPSLPENRPRSPMFEQRYEHFRDLYNWAR